MIQTDCGLGWCHGGAAQWLGKADGKVAGAAAVELELPTQLWSLRVRRRLVLFVSSLEHEVLPAWRPRYALTTWMFNRRDTALEAMTETLRQRQQAGRLDTKALLAALDADSSSDDEGEEMDSATAKKVMIMLLKRRQERSAGGQVEGSEESSA